MSRSWPRVASPCGGSNLITSAPIHASSCEHVGPACTCVMSRIRTPFNAFICFSNACGVERRLLPSAPTIAPLFFTGSRFLLLLFGGRIQRRDASALRARAFRDAGVDEGGTLRLERLV